MSDDYCIITFSNTHRAIATEQRLLSAGLSVRIIPIPTQITADCGLSVRFMPSDYPAVQSLTEDTPGVAFYSVHCEGRKKEVLPMA